MPQHIRPADQALHLMYHTRGATPFFSQGGEPCANIPTGVGSCRILPLRSAEFRDWLTASYYSEFETAPSALALRSVLRTLEARARYGDSPAQKVDHRIGFQGDPFAPSKIFLDLTNPAGEILEITSQGWNVADSVHGPFRRSPGALPFPNPPSNQPPTTSHSVLSQFADLFHLTPSTRTRIFFWIAAALRPIGPYPILVLRGPGGSGKSALARALRSLIDPSAAPLRRLPQRSRELLQLASHNWLLVFDFVYRIPIKISEALCAVSSADAAETAQLDYRDNTVAEIARPIILIAPLDETQPPWTPARSLSNRTLTVDLAPLAAPRSEAALWSDFEALRAPLMAALADALTCVLGRVREIDLGNLARFPDCAAWAVAAAPALNLDPTGIVEAVADPDFMWIGSDPVRDTLYTLLASNLSWSGDTASLLTQLRALAPLATLPSTPKGLSQALARIPGIDVVKGKGSNGQRTLSILRFNEKSRHQTQNHP